MVKKVNHSELSNLIDVYYKHKIALMVYGSFGLGKSETIRAKAQEIAKGKDRIFVEWNKLSKTEKQEVNTNADKYFILLDIRLSEFDSSDTKGLPDFKADKESIEWKSPFWAKVLENPKSDGILFFDEINLATPLVISSVYKIIYDRIINESKINDTWLIMGAGNLSEDRAYTHDLSPPVRDRGGEVELQSPSAESWSEWAVMNNIDKRIIAFVNFKPSSLHLVDFSDRQKFTTERGWNRLNTLISGLKDYKDLDLVCTSAIGEGIAKEFVAFCKIQDKINLTEIFNNPDKIKDISDISTKYFITTSFAEAYKNKKIKFDGIAKASKILDEIGNQEFVALLWRLCIRINKNAFSKDFKLSNQLNDLSDKFSKYLID